MLIEQITEFQLKEAGLYLYVCSTTDYFHDKTNTLKQNFRVDYYLLLKYCRR